MFRGDVVSCSSDLTVKIWDTNNDWKNVKTLYGHDHSISSAKFLPNDDFIVSASRDRTIRVWEVSSGYVFFPSVFSLVVRFEAKKLIRAW